MTSSNLELPSASVARLSFARSPGGPVALRPRLSPGMPFRSAGCCRC